LLSVFSLLLLPHNHVSAWPTPVVHAFLSWQMQLETGLSFIFENFLILIKTARAQLQ